MDRRRRKGVGMPAPPVRSRAPPSRRLQPPQDSSTGQKSSSSSVPTMTRSSMLVMEANEIAQILKKDYDFRMAEEVSGDENLTRIHVHQRKLSISCVWTLAKLKQRLVRMRKLMYADESEGQGMGCETVFFDPKDVWVRDDDAKTPTNENQGRGQQNDSSENQSDKENVVPNGHHGDSGSNSHGNNHNPRETLSNEAVLPSVSVSVVLPNSRTSTSKEIFPVEHVTPPNLNSNNNQQHQQSNASRHSNGSSFSMTSSSELPADSEFLSMTSSPMSPPLPPKDFGQHSGPKILPEKYLAKSSPGEEQVQKSMEATGSLDTVDNTLTADPQLSKYTPIIKTRSPSNQSLVKPSSKKSKKKEGAISFNLDVTKSPQKGGVIGKDSQGPKIGVSNNWVTVKPRGEEGHMVTKAQHANKSASAANKHGISHQVSAAGEEAMKAFVCEKCGGGKTGGNKKGSKKGISMLRMCRDMVKTLAYRSKGPIRQDLLVDRILYNVEVIKVAVINVLEAYTQAQESKQDIAIFADSDLLKLTSMQLVCALELLVSHSSLWMTSCDEEDLVRDICTALHVSVQELATEMVTFLQACETDQDSLASESSTKIIDELYELVRCCGELGIAMETCPTVLMDKPQQQASLAELRALKQRREDDLINMKPGQDIKQAFIAGSDLWTDRHLQSSVNAVAQCQKQAQMLSEDCLANQCSEQVAKQIYVTVGTIRIMTLKYQDIQVSVTSEVKEDRPRSDNYFHHYFLRSQSMLTHLTALVDSTALVLQAAEPLVDEEDAGVLKKVWRCAEMIHNATVKLAFASNMDQSKQFLQNSFSSNSSLNGLSLEMNLPKLTGMSAILSENQCEELQQCTEEVKLAIHKLIAIIKKRLPSSAFGVSTSGKVKRMLPATPGAGTGRQMLRCKSAKTHERIRRSQSYYDISGDM